MTVFEHAMLGTTLALAAGLHRRFGWRIVAVAGLAATVADWDGVSLLFGAEAYASYHRRLAHNLLVAGVLGMAVGWAEFQFGFADRLIRRMTTTETPTDKAPWLPVWLATGVLAALSHIPADVIYSGAPGTPVWGVPILWPFSEREWAFPLVPWGDLGATLLFIAEMFALYRWPPRAQPIAVLTLVALLGYMAARSA